MINACISNKPFTSKKMFENHHLTKLNNSFTQSELNYIRDKESIKIHLEEDWLPFNFTEDGKAKGFVNDYIRLIAKKIALKVEFIKGNTWQKGMELLKNNKIDIIGNMTITKNRKKDYLFSKKALFNINISLVTLKNKKNLTLEELEGKTLAIIKGYQSGNSIKKHYPKIKYIELDSNLDILKFVLNGKADAGLGSYGVLSTLIKRNFLSGLNIYYIKNKKYTVEIPQYLGFNKQNIILKNIIDKAMKKITNEELDKIKNRWFNISQNNKPRLTKEEIKYLKNKIIKVNTATSWLPMNFKDKQGEIVGIGIDFWKLIAKRAGIKYKIIESKTFADVLDNIKHKKYDINMATTKTIDKRAYSIFSKTYEDFPIAIATLKNQKFIINGIKLEGKKVAVGKKYSAYFLLKKLYPKINFVFTKNTKEALELVKSKKVFATVDIEPSLQYQILYNNFKNIKITGVTGINFNLQIMIRDDYTLLQSIINKTIDTISNDDKIAIYKKWLLFNQQESIDYTLIWRILLIFLFISLVGILWLITLKKSNIKLKNAKSEIIKLNNNLELKIKEEVDKNKQQQLIMLRQSRLAQMGEMISMIAHQWRQPLNNLAIINQLIVLKYKRGKLDDKLIENFEKNFEKQISYMSDTIDNFRDFFKPEKEKVDFFINNSIENVLNILSPILKNEDIELNYTYDKIYNLNGYPNELGQAFLNILNNAKDALIQNEIESKKINIDITKENEYILVTISDNAGGIEEKIMDKIFNPYFSTKMEKNGTGLGLYMTNLIIQEHLGGQITVSNNKEGAVFKIFLKGKE